MLQILKILSVFGFIYMIKFFSDPNYEKTMNNSIDKVINKGISLYYRRVSKQFDNDLRDIINEE